MGDASRERVGRLDIRRPVVSTFALRLSTFDFRLSTFVLLDAHHHPGNLLGFQLLAKPKRRVGRHLRGIRIRPEHPIPEAERRPVIRPRETRRVVHAVIRRRDDDVAQRTDVDLQVRVLPELDQQPDRIADAGFERAQGLLLEIRAASQESTG